MKFCCHCCSVSVSVKQLLGLSIRACVNTPKQGKLPITTFYFHILWGEVVSVAHGLLLFTISGDKISFSRNIPLPDAGGESIPVCVLLWRVGLSNVPVIDTDISSSSWFTSWFMSESESLLRILSDFWSSNRAWVSSTFGWFWTCTTASIGCIERPLVVATSLFVLTLFCSALMCILSRRLSSGPAPPSAPDSIASDISLSDRTSTSDPSVQIRLLVIASEISSSPLSTLWFLRYPALRAPSSSYPVKKTKQS